MGDLLVLRARLEDLGAVTVAFSGGADSAFLAWVAKDTLGADRAVAVTAVSPSLAPEELAADRPIEVSFLPRREAVLDDDLIRTKVNLIPESVAEIRVVDIVGLDKQADGGTHVRSTAEVGRVRMVKTESKGKGNKRIRIEVVDG